MRRMASSAAAAARSTTLTRMVTRAAVSTPAGPASVAAFRTAFNSAARAWQRPGTSARAEVLVERPPHRLGARRESAWPGRRPRGGAPTAGMRPDPSHGSRRSLARPAPRRVRQSRQGRLAPRSGLARHPPACRRASGGDRRRGAPLPRAWRQSASPRVTSAIARREIDTAHRLAAPVVGQAPLGLANEPERVVDAAVALALPQRTGQEMAARALDRQQMSSQVAAVDRRDVAWLEWREPPCVVPVVEVSAEPLELSALRRASPRADRSCRAYPASQGRERPGWTGGTGRRWSARCDAPGPDFGSSWKLSGGR